MLEMREGQELLTFPGAEGYQISWGARSMIHDSVHKSQQVHPLNPQSIHRQVADDRQNQSQKSRMRSVGGIWDR